MEIDLCKTEETYYQRVESGGMAFKAETEMIVPDVMPDIGEIVSAYGLPLVRAKVFSDGVLTLSGSVQTQILYLADSESVLRKLELEIPFSCSEENNAPEGSLFTHSVRLAYVDAKILNPRKLSVCCELCADIDRFDNARLRYAGVDTDEENDFGVCIKTESVTADLIDGVYEKSFIVTDTFPLTGTQSEACELLGKTVTLSCEEVKFVGSKLILKGNIHTDLLWRTEAEEIGAAGFDSVFSQIVEVGEGDSPNASTRLTLSGAYFELLFTASDTRTVSAELHILAQVICTSRRDFLFVTDAYSNRFPIQAHFCTPQTLCTGEHISKSDSMRGLIETPYPVREVLLSTASPGSSSAADIGYTCPINVRLLLRDEEGNLHGIVRSFAAKWDAPSGDSGSESIHNVFCRNLQASSAPGGAEIRVVAIADILRCSAVQITPLESVEPDESARIDLSSFPTVTVLPSKYTDLWQLAKRYHSTLDLIEQANSDPASTVMIIPRAR